VIGVIDLDSYEFDRYSELEQNALEKIAQMLSKGCDWSNW
jgi:putative methionine-R-sulfoxide reductase with GAF domain